MVPREKFRFYYRFKKKKNWLNNPYFFVHFQNQSFGGTIWYLRIIFLIQIKA